MARDIEKKISPSVRTLFLESEISSDVLLKLEHLHVLKLSGGNVKMLPTSIGALKHLRFLDISDSEIKILPKSLCNLYNLQTLRIDIFKLNGLPKRLSNLINLRHLHTEKYYFSNFEMPLEMGQLTWLVTLEFFNVGQEKGRRIEEIGNLKHLKGFLAIGNLEQVNGKEGAQLAKLFEKPYLSSLELKWGREEDGEADTYDGDDDVLEGLQPHPNLQELVIKNFMGYQFPQWLLNLSALGDLELRNCKRCTQLPALGKMPSLRRLRCFGLENIRCIGLSFYGIDEGGSRSTVSGRVFPSLEDLSWINMENLVEWKEVDEEEVDLFPMLRKLRIDNCSQLTAAPNHFPNIYRFQALRSLKIRGCPRINRLSLPKEGQKSLLRSLETLRIHDCNGLINIKLESCASSLRKLEVYRCPNLVSFPLGSLTRLEELTLDYSSFEFNASSSVPPLRELRLYGLSHVESLPAGLQFFTTLTSLQLLHFGLEVLPDWIGNLASLETLHLSDCQKLQYLPSIATMKGLTKLERLWIFDCHLLKERCAPNSGTDSEWLKISHIRQRYIF